MFLPTSSSLFLYFVILSLTILHSVSSFGIFPTKTFLQKTITRKLPPRQTSIQSKELFRLYGGKSSQVIEIGSLSQLEDILASAEKDSKLVVLDFTASWCPPCKMISPIFAKLAESKEFDGKAIFAKVDVDETPEVTQKYQISAMPTFRFIKNHKVIDGFSGANESKLTDTIRKHL